MNPTAALTPGDMAFSTPPPGLGLSNLWTTSYQAVTEVKRNSEGNEVSFG